MLGGGGGRKGGGGGGGGEGSLSVDDDERRGVRSIMGIGGREVNAGRTGVRVL